MRILHTDTDDLDNPLRGGQPVRTFEINSRLARRHEVTVVTASYPGCVRRLSRAGVDYRRLGISIPGFGLSSHLSFLAGLAYAARQIPHDLVVEEFNPPVGYCGLPWWSGKPVVSMVQWFFFRDWERRYRLPFERWMRGIGARGRYRNFIVQTDRMGDIFRDMLPDAKVWKVPCGIGAESFRAPLGQGDYALFLGRLDVGHKGLDFMLSAWKLLVAAGVRVPLKVAGAGLAEPWLREQIRLAALDDCIELVGRVEGDAKTELLAGSRFLVMPSRQETFGLTALEAMAASRPVIAFDIEHLNELVRPAWGRLLPMGSVEALADAVGELWNAPELAASLGLAARNAAGMYSWDVLAERQEQIYEEVLHKGENI